MLVPALFLAPSLITLGVWIYLPLFESFWLSFFEWNMLPTSPKVFVGLDNYARLLALPEVGNATLNTVYYTLGLLPLTVLLPLVVALTTQRLQGPFRNLYRATIFLPLIMAPVVVAVIWRWLLNPEFGLINKAITSLGFTKVQFLNDPDIALWVILFLTGWKLIGFSTLVFSAAITQVDKALTEAARMDGAGDLRLSIDIILPLISPAIFFISLLTILHGAQWSFAYINVLTQGGPLQSTTNLFYLMYEYGFGNFAVGWSTASGVLLFIGFGLIAIVCLRLMQRYATYVN
ncbi:MAG: sugar ABC transporter permease [Alphaproteobacteria bacterium]|nr:sugar ABC transporter permease [Alphaproteobacteria bacterium]